MIIYVDLVFIINILLDFILLMGVSVILTRNVKIKRLLLGSLIGGLSTLLLFININSLLSFFLKIILGLLMVIVTFNYHSIKYTLNNLFYLFNLSFITGGVMYLLDNKYNYLVLLLAFIVVLYLYVKMAKRYQVSYTNYYKVKIVINNENYDVIGYLDTGNNLIYHNKPVIILDKKIKYDLEDIIYVPYTSLNNTSVLKCLRTDRIIINNHIFNNYLVGLSNKKINIDGINCILHNKMKGMI